MAEIEAAEKTEGKTPYAQIARIDLRVPRGSAGGSKRHFTAEARGARSSEQRFRGKDPAPPARSGLISAVLAVPRPLKREREASPRVVSSPPKALRERLQPHLLPPYWPGSG